MAGSAELQERQEVTRLTQELEAAKVQLEQLTMQLAKVQATTTPLAPQHSQPIIEAEEGVVVEGSDDGTATASRFCRDEGSGATCMIELRADFAPMLQAGAQADFETGFVEALTHVTLEQLVLRLSGRHEHATAQAATERARQENSINQQETKPGVALQGWLEQCHAQSYYDRLVAQVSTFNFQHSVFQQQHYCTFRVG